MNLGKGTVWQVACGDTNRSYHDLCLRWDVILFGPGYQGPWPDCAPGLARDDWTTRKIGLIEKFCEEVADGDLVVLRLGTSEVFGVGNVIGSYHWYDDFGDVDGWDLQFVRRVKWLWRYGTEPKRFPTYALKFGDTIQILDSEPVLEWLKILEIPPQAYHRELVELPATCVHGSTHDEVPTAQLAEYLYDEGVAEDSIEAVLSGMDGLTRVASWYDRSGEEPSEAETIAYLVVPLLRALGWTSQKMAVEWNRVDAALFARLPRKDENLTIVVEVKKRNRSCLSAKSQAEDYAEQPGREGCRRLIVTDGIRYGVYVRDESGRFRDRPHAYLNLNRLRHAYPVLECAGAREALRMMAPDWNPETPTQLKQGVGGEGTRDG